jgi:hypothetical protein
MRIASLPLLVAAVVPALFLAACSSTSGNSGNSGSGSSDCATKLKAAANSEFCEGDATKPNCSLVTAAYVDQVCGVPLKVPPADLTRSSGLKEYSGSGPAQTACFSKAGYPKAPGTSSKVKLGGVAKIFSSGCESHDLKIEVYTVKRTGGADDGEPDQLIGASVTTASDCKAGGVSSPDPDKCGTRYECSFTYDDVPSETELLIKTSGATWKDLYEYDVYVPNDEVKNGVYTKNVRALAQDDYSVIPQAAIGGPITPGHGAIAGEVHDCGDVRVSNAVVDIDVSKAQTVYFTDNEDHPLPDPQGHPKGTSTLGLYAALDVKPGPVTVAAAGNVGGQLVTLGFLHARVFPDSVTSVTFRGMRPFQLPK